MEGIHATIQEKKDLRTGRIHGAQDGTQVAGVLRRDQGNTRLKACEIAQLRCLLTNNRDQPLRIILFCH